MVHFTTLSSAYNMSKGNLANAAISYKLAIEEHNKAVAAAQQAGQKVVIDKPA